MPQQLSRSRQTHKKKKRLTNLDAAKLDREASRVLVLVGVASDAPEVSVRLEDASNLGLGRLRGEVVHDEAALLVAEAGVELDAEVHRRPRPRSLLLKDRT